MKPYDEFRMRKVENGYVMTHIPKGTDEKEYKEIVGTDGDFDDNEHDSWANFLCAINSIWGPSDGKCSPKRVMVSVEPGEDTDGMSWDEDWTYQYLLEQKEEGMSWEDFGKKVHKLMKEELEKSKEFKAKEGYNI